MLQYGNDIELIKTRYSGIKAHVDFLARQASYGGGVPQFGLLGDWCSVEPFCPGSSDGCLRNPGWTNGDATSAFYFLKSLEDLIRMAKAAAGAHSSDVAKYTQLLTTAKAAYHGAFWNASTQCYGEAQTGNALAIAAGVVPPESMAGTVSSLTSNILARGKHLSTGGVGARWLLQALSAANQTALALDLAAQTTAPSWYDFVRAGPGTLHETWGKPAVPPSTGGVVCNSSCEMLAVHGAGYWGGDGDQPLPGASSATTAPECSAACLKDARCVQMTWAPTHPVKCSLYTSISQGSGLQHNPGCTASAVKCKHGAADPAKCAAFGRGSAGHPGSEGGSHNHIMLAGGVDPWLYHEVGGLRLLSSPAEQPPRLLLGVECEVMRRVRGATAETRIHGHRARSSWRWLVEGGTELEYGVTVPVGFSGSLTLAGDCGGATVISLLEGEGDEQALVWSLASETVTRNLPVDPAAAAAIAPVAIAGVGPIRRNADGDLELELLSGVFHFRASFARA